MGRLTRTILTMIIAVFMVVTNILTPNTRAVTTVNAAAGDVPAHAKFRGNNGDGTYKLALNVTGESEKIYTKTNVIVILDISGSMDERVSGGSTRMAAATRAVNSLANSLLSKNGQNGQPADLFEMALVTFSNTANIRTFGSSGSQKTTSYSTYSGVVNNLTANGGTNWEDALHDANNVNFNDNDQTFVIFVSDGNPTFRNTRGNYSSMDDDYYRTYGVYGTGNDGNATTVARCYEHAVDDAETLATSVGANRFFTIGAYGNVDRMQSLTTAAGAPAGNYFSASNTAALEAAFAAILDQIATAGIAEADIHDQTTAVVPHSSGVAVSHLLEVDETSFKYYRAGGTNDNGTVKYNPTANTMQGIASGESSESTKNLGVEWTAADDPAPPAATVNSETGEVEWDLSSLDVLENGVTYTVTFDVYPSQYTYDLIAKLKNADDPQTEYEKLDENIRKYLVPTDSTYTNFALETNKTATLNYDDTRTTEGTQTAKYDNPPAVPTVAEQLNVVKEWHGEYKDEEKAASFDMKIHQNGKEYETVTLTYDAASKTHKGSAYISTGLMRVNKDAGTVQVLDEGYDYKLIEPDNLSYHWELQADTLHPMLVNGVLTVLKEDTAPAGMGSAQYYKSGNIEYYVIKGKVYSTNTDAASLKAVNIRRANLNLTKAVDGTHAPADATFTFKMTVTDPDGEDVWFSVAEGSAADSPLVMDETILNVSGATAEVNTAGAKTGYYYAESGSEVTVSIKAGWNVRFTNVLTGTTYTFEEVDETLEKGFTFESTALDIIDESTNEQVGSTETGSSLVKSGTVEIGNTRYTVTYTNEYTPAEFYPSVKKQVTGWNAIEAFDFSLAPADTVTSAAVDAGDIVIGSAEATSAADIKEGETADVPFEKPIIFYKEGTYKFTYDETTTASDSHWTYDANTYELTVVVETGTDGKLKVTSATDAPTFVNRYTPDPVEAEIPVLKKVTPDEGLNPGDITGKFTFTLAAGTSRLADGSIGTSPMPNNQTTATVLCGTSGEIVYFPAINYPAVGTYEYTITESVTPNQNAGGYELDSSNPKTISVVVTFNSKTGKLEASVNGGEALDFNNPYHVFSTTITIPVEKILSVPEGLTPDDITGKFTFTLTAAEGTPMPATTSLTNPSATGGKMTFGDPETTGAITITKPGTYTYTVTESGEVDGITNDPDAVTGKTYTVAVRDKGDGTLEAVYPTDSVVFTNRYSVEPTTASFPVKKIVSAPEGLTGPADWSYSINVDANGEAPEAATMTGTVTKASDTATFGPFEYTAPGTYTYTVTETGTVAGVTNDAAATTGKTVTVNVKDNGDGTLTATPSSTADNPLTFTNTYNAEVTNITIPVEKILSVPEGLTPDDITGKFTFTLTAAEGTPMPATTSLTNPSATGGNMTFGDEQTTGPITITKPGTYEYTITESGGAEGVTNDATASKTFTVTVVDNGDGTLRPIYPDNPSKVTFTNRYSVDSTTVSFPVKKIVSVPEGLTGPADWSYTINVAANNGAPKAGTMTGTVTNAADTATFGPFTYTAPGTYTYTVTETGTVAGVTNDAEAATGKTVTVNVKDNGDGTLTATADSTTENPVKFINTYSVGTINATPAVRKSLVGAQADLKLPDITEEYTFTLTAVTEGAPMPAEGGDKVKNPAADGGTVSFGSITFSAPGRYVYKVTESGEVNGVTNDADAENGKTFTVIISDNGDSTLSQRIEYPTEDGHVVFTNTYDVQPVTAKIPVEKILEVPEGLTPGDIKGQFTFTLTAEDGTPMPEVTSYTNPDADGGTVEFGDITYTKPGEYTYTVTETGSAPGVQNDPTAAKTVTVNVVDNSDGTMKATVVGDKVSFKNTYNVTPTEAEFPVKKVLEVPEGLKGPETWNYTINVAAVDGAPAGSTMTGTVDQDNNTVTFKGFRFTKPGTYKYTVTETGTVAGVTNDPDAKTVTITVKDNGDGTMTATADSTTDKPLTFTNTYNIGSTTASFPVKKDLVIPEGLKGPAEWSYTINVAANDGAPAAETMTGTVSNGEGKDIVTFGPFTYTAPGTYTYTVSETGTIAGVANDKDAAGKTVTVTVKDNGDGTLTATADSTTEKPLTFTNTYSVEQTTAKFPVEKILTVPEGLTGPEDWSYTINVAANGGAPAAATMSGTVTKNAPSITFGDFTYTAPGTYTYTVSETGTIAGVTNDAQAAGKTVTVEVVDNGDGTLTATASSTTDVPLTFTNTYNIGETEVSFPVKKIMSVPAGLTGPATWSYTIDVAANDSAPEAETMTGTVDQDTDTVTFGPFKYTAPGTYTYTVSETGTVDGVTNDAQAAGKTVTVTVVDNGDGTLTASADSNAETTLTFTNTYSVDPTKASFPVEKILTVPAGMEGPSDWSYDIAVTAAEGTPVAETMTGKVTKAEPSITFGDFTYTLPGTYTYTVSETGTVAGVTNDAEAAGKKVTVTVVDNGDGTLTATADATDEKPLTFTNTYDVGATTVTFPVKKILSVPEGLKGPASWSYTVDVVPNDGAPRADKMTGTVSNTADTVTFGPFTYTTPGTYTYTVSETGTIAGVTNDAEAAGKTVTVTVVDNHDGTLTATADSTDEKPLTFTNTYSVKPTTAKFPVEKILTVPEGLTGPEDWSYTINVAANDGAPAAEKMDGTVTKAAPSITFGDFTYTAPGTYTYTVSETGDIKGVTNDKEAAGKTVTIEVVDNGDGTLTATASSTTEKPLTFTNTYNVEPKPVSVIFQKIVDVMNPNAESAVFNFELTPASGSPAPASLTAAVTVTAAGEYNINFGDITFTKEGTYEYTLTEVVDDTMDEGWVITGSPAKATVKVTDNHDGTLTAEVTMGEIKNTYETVEVKGIKKWDDDSNRDGVRPENITVRLLKDGVEYKNVVLSAADQSDDAGNEWAFSFTNLPKYAKHGTEVVYTVSEDSVENYTTKIEGDQATGFTITNSYAPGRTTVTATKVWEDDNDRDGLRPQTIELTLTGTAGEKEVYSDTQTVRAAADGSWSYTWTDLFVKSEGTDITYVVTEKAIDNYTTEITGDQKQGYTITNTHEIETIDIPVTKIWNDDNNKDNTRPDDITVNLLADGKAIDTVVIGEAEEWKHTFTDLPVYRDQRTEIVYTVTENTVDKYTTVITGDKTAGFTITNSHQNDPEKHIYTGTSETFIDGQRVEPGQELTYTVSYKNTTGKTVETATITDTIPAHTTYVEGSADNSGVFAAGKITWTFTNVADGETRTVSFKVTVNDDTTGAALKNTSVVNDGENEYTSNEVTNPTPTLPVKDVFAAGDEVNSIDGVKVIRGQELIYKITYKNTTGADVTATITDKIPELTEFVSADNGGTEADGVVTWTLDVANGAEVTVSFTVKVKDTVNGEVIPNTAKVNDGTNEFTTNEVKNPTPTQPVKTVYTGTSETNIDGRKVEPGEELTYKITYKNTTGEELPVTAVITDTIPAHTTYVEGSASNNGTYDAATGKIVWTIQVAQDEEVTVSFKVKVDEKAATEPITNDAVVNDGKNNFDTNEVVNTVPTPPTKDVFKSEDTTTSIDGEQVHPGDQLTYVITYTNTTGEKEPTDVTITDTIPQYTEFVEATEGGTFADGVVTWNLTVANGETKSVAFSVKVVGDADGVKIPNTAKVRKGENEYTTNEVVNYVPSEPVKEVFTAESTTNIDGYKVEPNDELTYKITYKNTTGKEATVTIEDAIPQYTTYVEGSADNDGVYADGKVTWTLTLAYEEEITVSFKVKVNEDAKTEPVKNTSTVREGENEYTTNEVVNTIPTPPTKDVFKSSDTTTSIDGEQVQPGDQLTYVITYTNTTGEKEPTDVTITDTIPQYTEFVEATEGGTFADGVVTWNLTVPNGETVKVAFSVKVVDDADGVKVPNTAKVRKGENEYDTNEVVNYVPTKPVKESFTATSETNIDGYKVEPGDELTYKITYKNTIGKEATVTIEDAIPEFTTYVEGSADNGGTFADGKITWTLTVPYEEEVTVSFKVKVNEDAKTEPVKNDAVVREGENEYTTNEVVNTIPTPPTKDVFKAADTTTSIDGEQVQPGEELTYQITYTNTTGEKEPAEVTITDTIPQYTEFVSADNGGTFTDGVVTWNLTVKNGETVKVSFTVKVADDADGVEVKNTAKVRKGENEYDTNEVVNYVPSEPVKESFTATSETNIDGNKVEPGDELTYKITYKNATGKEATVTIEDAIPEFTTYVEGSADHDGVYADGKVTWTLTLAYEEEVTVSFKVKVNEDAKTEPVKNTATVREGENEYTTNEVVNTIPTPPTKDVFKAADTETSIDGEQVQPGEELTYQITYTNTTGEKEPAEVTITDTIPQYTEFVSADNGGTFTDGVVTWSLTVKNGETVTVSFTVKVADDADGVEVKNTAKVRKGENEYDTNEVVNYVPSKPVKESFKPADTTTNIDGKQVKVDEELTYTITYKNTTGKDAEVTIEDTIPAYTDFVSVSNDGVYADGKVTWTMTVPNGETVKVSFTVKVQKNVGGNEVKNTAVVREGENEYTTNEVVNSIPTPPTKDVYKTSKPTVSIKNTLVNPGDKLTYAIFYTNTTGEDADVTITDNIPAHTTFVSADNGGTFANGTVTWNLKVKNGESVKVTFNVTVDEVTAGTDIKNTAKVIEGENEYNTNEVINTVPTPKTGDEADYRAFRMHCFTLAGSLIVFLAALVMLILNRKKEEEFLSKR